MLCCSRTNKARKYTAQTVSKVVAGRETCVFYCRPCWSIATACLCTPGRFDFFGLGRPLNLLDCLLSGGELEGGVYPTAQKTKNRLQSFFKSCVCETTFEQVCTACVVI